MMFKSYGYLKKELPQCGAANNVDVRPHIPRTTIDVKIWRDHESCCPDTKDYSVCKAIKCLPTDDPNGIDQVKDPWTKLQVGYYYKGEKKTSDNTKLIFTTTGSLISRLTGNDPLLSEYNCIIIDEAHEFFGNIGRAKKRVDTRNNLLNIDSPFIFNLS